MIVIRPLPGSIDRFDRQHLAADLGPGQAGDDADQVLGLGLAVAELAHAGVLVEVLAGDRDLRRASCVRISLIALRARLASSRSRLRTPASRV